MQAGRHWQHTSSANKPAGGSSKAGDMRAHLGPPKGLFVRTPVGYPKGIFDGKRGFSNWIPCHSGWRLSGRAFRCTKGGPQEAGGACAGCSGHAAVVVVHLGFGENLPKTLGYKSIKVKSSTLKCNPPRGASKPKLELGLRPQRAWVVEFPARPLGDPKMNAMGAGETGGTSRLVGTVGGVEEVIVTVTTVLMQHLGR